MKMMIAGLLGIASHGCRVRACACRKGLIGGQKGRWGRSEYDDQDHDNDVSQDGLAPLHRAAQSGYLEVMRALLSVKKCKKDIKNKVRHIFVWLSQSWKL